MSYAPSISDAVTTAPRVVWVADIIGSDEAMVGRGFTSILETQDVKIAAPKTTTAGYSMQAALISATLNPAIADWLDAPNASLLDLWNAGEIDAAYASGDVLTALLNAGATPLITSAELAAPPRATCRRPWSNSATSEATVLPCGPPAGLQICSGSLA